MRDFNQFLIEQDGALFNELFGFGKPSWQGYLQQLTKTNEGPIATRIAQMFSKGMSQQDYLWVKQNINALWNFLNKHRAGLTQAGVDVDALVRQFGLYNPKDYAKTGNRYTNDFERAGFDASQGF